MSKLHKINNDHPSSTPMINMNYGTICYGTLTSLKMATYYKYNYAKKMLKFNYSVKIVPEYNIKYHLAIFDNFLVKVTHACE
ncbi:hypothetical protein U3516DRAFT_742379 [Neocallimastix sp. 'constans']